VGLANNGDTVTVGEKRLGLLTRSSAARRLSSYGVPVQFLQFCAVGGSGYLINLVAFTALFRAAGLSYLLAAVGAFTLAATSNYTWNRLWTFRAERGRIALQGTQFLMVAGGALGANLLLLLVLVGVGIGPVLAQAAAIVLVTPLNFLGNKLWTFRARPSPYAVAGRSLFDPAAAARDGTVARRAPEPRPTLEPRAAPWAVRVPSAWLTRARALVRGPVVLRFLGFSFISLNAVVLNTAVFAACVAWLDLPYALAGFLGAQLGALWSYVFLEAWVFSNRTYARGAPARLAWFLVVTNAAVAVTSPLLLALSTLGLSYLAANLVLVTSLTVVRFALADAWIWQAERRGALDPAEASPATTLLRRARAARMGAAEGRPELVPSPLGGESRT
jgi:putative flippase GtrA